ncbi:MAG: chemotaxis protein CheW [Acidobacteria bacterium]|nr:chemotaxis protein CheW [Acidobacteriota bacterium]
MIELEELPVVAETAPDDLTEPASGEKFISFEIGEQLFCVAAVSVQEVVHPISPAAVPLGPPWLLGLGALRGEPVALIDPSTVAVPSRLFANGKPKTIVFHSLANRTQFALPVDSLREIIVVEPKSLKSGEFVHDGRPIKLIEHDRLFNSFEGTAI